MKLWKIIIKTYNFGIKRYELFVLADTEDAMLMLVNQYPAIKKDEDALIEYYEQIDLTKQINRVL